jgi:hypothetical protein
VRAPNSSLLQFGRSNPLHRVISAEDKVDRLEACTASLPPEAVELDAQREAVAAEPRAQREAAVAAAEPVAQREAVVAAVEPVAQREAAAVAAVEPVAQREAVVAAAEPDAQQEAAAVVELVAQ